MLTLLIFLNNLYPVNQPLVEPYKSISEVSEEFTVDPVLLSAIAKCESGLHQYNQKNGEVLHGAEHYPDTGIMQINASVHEARAEKLSMDIYTLKGNLRYGAKLLHDEGIKPWAMQTRECVKNILHPVLRV